MKADTRFAPLPLLAFAGHVEADKHEAARIAGADMVAANSSNPWAVAYLLARGADPSFRNRHAMNALELVQESLESAFHDRRKYRQQIAECGLILEMLRIAG